MPPRVLVTNARRRNAVPVVRSLGRAGFTVAAADSTPRAMAFVSRFCAERLVHPPVADADAFFESLLGWLHSHPTDAILPVDDDVLLLLSQRRDLLPNPDALLLPDHETLLFANDKSRLVPYAGQFGLAVPETVVVREAADVEGVLALTFPVVAKPALGAGSRGIARFSDFKSLAAFLSPDILSRTAYLVQETVPPEGEGLGFFALYDRNRSLVAQFMHRRLREYPVSGGPSTLRESVFDPDLAQKAKNLLESLSWAGLAMVEFKMDPRDGVPRLMEINPRLWGSVALPIFAGVDFPVLAVRAAMGERLAPVLDYPSGKQARWLWPGDILHLAARLKRGQWPRGFLKFFGKDLGYDLLSLEDPVPAMALPFYLFLELLGSEGRKHYLKRG